MSIHTKITGAADHSLPKCILLIHLISDAQHFSFEDETEHLWKQQLQQDEVLFSLDNYSNTTALAYARTLIHQASQLLFVLNFQDQQAVPGPVSSLLNAALQKPDTRLLTNWPAPFLKPFLVRFRGKVTENLTFNEW